MDTWNPEPEPTNPYDYHSDVAEFTFNMFLVLIFMAGSCRLGSGIHRCWRECSQHLRNTRQTQVALNIHTHLITEESLSKSLLTECPICLETYQTNENVVNLPCNHIFHVSCIKDWFAEHTTCPVCRDNLMLRVPQNSHLIDI